MKKGQFRLDIDRAGFLDASILGETVHPRNFNALRRIREEDGTIIEEEETFSELASNEFLLQSLRNFISSDGKDTFDNLPDGIHSGLVKENAKGVFFYFKTKSKDIQSQHFWKYYDLTSKHIIDNRFLVANMIACDRDTPRIVDQEVYKNIFELQEIVLEDILESVSKKRALEIAPRSIDPIQQTIITVIQSYINHPDVNRSACVQLIRELSKPMLTYQIKELRAHYNTYQKDNSIKMLIANLNKMYDETDSDGNDQQDHESDNNSLRREDLQLICFDVISS